MKVISGSPSSNTEPYKCQRTLPKEKVRGVEKAPSNNTAWEEGTQRENTGQIREVRIATASDQNSARALYICAARQCGSRYTTSALTPTVGRDENKGSTNSEWQRGKCHVFSITAALAGTLALFLHTRSGTSVSKIGAHVVEKKKV